MTPEFWIGLIALLVALVGPPITFYANSQVVESRLSRAEVDIKELERKHDELGPVLVGIREDLSRIKGLLEARK